MCRASHSSIGGLPSVVCLECDRKTSMWKPGPLGTLAPWKKK